MTVVSGHSRVGVPDEPLVTVVIPAFNSAAYLPEAIESAVRQTHRQTQIIVVDDGSTDSTSDVLSGWGTVIESIRQDNAGPAAALNRGVALAQGAFISFLSADDVWMPEKLAWQLQTLAEAPQLDMIFGHMQHFVSPELDQSRAATLRCPADPMPAYSAGTLLTRLDKFRSVGAFDERLVAGEFIDWYTRALDAGLTAVMLPTVVSRRRVHRENHSLRTNAPSSYLRVLKAALDRRRSREV